MSSLRDVRCPVQCSSSWRCSADVSSVLHISGPESAARSRPIPARVECVSLELPSVTEDGLACTLSLLCAPQGAAHILDVALSSEARTIELYSCTYDNQEEEYLGTSRGERHCTFSGDGEEDTVTLYKTHVKLDVPVPACKVKLLSLGGRRRVLVSEIMIQLTSIPEIPASPLLGPSINMDRVQSIMDSMGGKMSPGAEQLMNMVRAQQKNQVPFGSHLLQMFGSLPSGRDHKGGRSRIDTHNTAGTGLETSQASEYPASCHQALPRDVNSLMSSIIQKQMGQAAKPECILHQLQNLALQKNQHKESGQESCLLSREERVDPALEKLLSAHMERLEMNLMKYIDQRMKHLQDHLDSRVDQLVCLMQDSRFDQHTLIPGDKLVNGHIRVIHEQERDGDLFMGH